MRLAFPLLLFLASAAIAQDDDSSGRFRVAIGLGSGNFAFETVDARPTEVLDDDTDAGMLRFQFEGTTRSGIGGGLRFEGIGTDDDLFVRNGANPSEIGYASLFGHATFRFQQHRFAMPLRFGLLLNGLVLNDTVTDQETSYSSIGPYLEIAPEVTLVGSRRSAWSLFGELGVGIAGTAIEVDGDYRDYESSTGFVGLELGTRLRFSAFELSVSYVGRWQSMDESDVEDGFVALGYDAEWNGILIQVGAVF